MRVILSTFFSIFPKNIPNANNLIAKPQLEKIKFKSYGFTVNERTPQLCSSWIFNDSGIR